MDKLQDALQEIDAVNQTTLKMIKEVTKVLLNPPPGIVINSQIALRRIELLIDDTLDHCDQVIETATILTNRQIRNTHEWEQYADHHKAIVQNTKLEQ